MKGSLHTDELLGAVVARETGLRTARRLSHAFIMDVPTYHKVLIVTDAAINIAPTLEEKVDICQNAIDLAHSLGVELPKVAVLAAVETVTSKMPATLDAAALCKMADRGQITGGLLDGPLAFDNAISKEAARTKGINSEVAGDPDILLAPDLEAGNILAKLLSFLANSDSAGLVLGAQGADHPHQPRRQCAVENRKLRGRGAGSACAPRSRRQASHGRLHAGAECGLVEPQVLRLPEIRRTRRGAWTARGQIEGIGTTPRFVAKDEGGATIADQALGAGGARRSRRTRCARELAAWPLRQRATFSASVIASCMAARVSPRPRS